MRESIAFNERFFGHFIFTFKLAIVRLDDRSWYRNTNLILDLAARNWNRDVDNLSLGLRRKGDLGGSDWTQIILLLLEKSGTG